MASGVAGERVRWVDVLKGVLILLVVFGHAVQGLAADATLATNPQIQGIHAARDVIYSFHMPAFFVVSGFFAGGLWRKDMVSQFKAKLRRLVKPYFLWGFLTACAMQLMSGFTNKGEGLADFLLSPVVPFSQFWYLYVLFCLFLLHCGLSVVLRQYADRALLGLAIVLYVAQPLVPDVWALRDLCQYALYYVLGMVVYPLLAGQRSRSDCLAVIATAVVLAATQRWGFFVAIAGFLATYGVSVTLSRFDGKVTDALAEFGQESLALYVTHLLAVQGLRIVFVRLLHVDNLWLVALAATALGTALCWAFIVLAKRTGLYRYLF